MRDPLGAYFRWLGGIENFTVAVGIILVTAAILVGLIQLVGWAL